MMDHGLGETCMRPICGRDFGREQAGNHFPLKLPSPAQPFEAASEVGECFHIP